MQLQKRDIFSHSLAMGGMHDTSWTLILYSATSNNNYEVGTLVIDGWAVTFGLLQKTEEGTVVRSGPSSLYQMLLPPINCQCTTHRISV